MAPIKIIIDREFTGNLRSVTISRNPAGQYYASVLVEEEIPIKPPTGRSVGIDLGLTHLLVLSDGTKIDNPRWFRDNQAKLKRAQQHLSRKKKGSSRYERQRIKVARIYLKITNQRKWFLHNISTWLVNSYDVICTEDLSVKNMVKNHSLAKSISDAGWSTLVSQLKYKSNWYGRTFTKVDMWFASSKMCSLCGNKQEEMGLEIREWTCPSCSILHNRDENAAKNILSRGLSDLYSLSSAESVDYIRGEELRPEVRIPVQLASSVKRRAETFSYA